MVLTKSGRGSFVAIAVVVLCVAAYLPFLSQRFGDFRAFYCSGQAVLAHADPYREHPLRECEHIVQAPGVSPLRDDAAIPAPFPGYVLALFAALALLPFGIAAAVWLAGSIGAVALACVFFARCVRAPVATLAILIGFPAVSAALQLGQLTPFVTLAISAAALLLAQGKPRAAAIAALGIAVEPHVAVAVFIALFIAVRQSRWPLIAGGAMLTVVSLITLGWSGNVEYLRDVLPGHALANLADVQQFSAAHIAALFGLAPVVARTIGSWWYLAAATGGVTIALRLKRRHGPQAIVLVPIAFEVFGGIYVHISQLAFAIPAFLLVMPRRGPARAVTLTAVFVTAMPWNMIVNYPMLVPAIAALAIAVCVSMDVEGLASTLAIAAALLFLTFFYTGVLGLAPAAVDHIAYHPTGNPLADDSWQHWQQWLAGQRTPAALAWSIAVKVPTLVAFTALLSSLTAAGLRRGRAHPMAGGARSPFAGGSVVES